MDSCALMRPGLFSAGTMKRSGDILFPIHCLALPILLTMIYSPYIGRASTYYRLAHYIFINRISCLSPLPEYMLLKGKNFCFVL